MNGLPKQTAQFVAFTSRYKGRSLRLTNEVEIFPAFDPATTPSPPQGKKYLALYDTGATNSAVSPRVVADFQLPSIRAKTVFVGSGSYVTSGHLVNVKLPNSVLFRMVDVAKLVLPVGIDALIGMDILGMGDFTVTHQDGNTTFSFCFPSRKEIDFAAELQSIQKGKPILAPHKPARNSPCHCGSGKKYKACHGR